VLVREENNDGGYHLQWVMTRHTTSNISEAEYASRTNHSCSYSHQKGTSSIIDSAVHNDVLVLEPDTQERLPG
jgi:hypothetical protein